MNTKQKEYLAKWLEENQFKTIPEPEWTPATVIHTFQVETIYKELKKLEE